MPIRPIGSGLGTPLQHERIVAAREELLRQRRDRKGRALAMAARTAAERKARNAETLREFQRAAASLRGDAGNNPDQALETDLATALYLSRLGGSDYTHRQSRRPSQQQHQEQRQEQQQQQQQRRRQYEEEEQQQQQQRRNEEQQAPQPENGSIASFLQSPLPQGPAAGDALGPDAYGDPFMSPQMYSLKARQAAEKDEQTQKLEEEVCTSLADLGCRLACRCALWLRLSPSHA